MLSPESRPYVPRLPSYVHIVRWLRRSVPSTNEQMEYIWVLILTVITIWCLIYFFRLRLDWNKAHHHLSQTNICVCRYGVTHLETTATIPLLLLWQAPNKNISCPHTQNNSIYSYKATCRGLLYVRGGWWPAIILLWRWRFFENRDASQIQGSDESFNLPGSRSVRLIIPEAAAIMHRVSGFDVRCQDCIVSNGVWLQVCRHAS